MIQKKSTLTQTNQCNTYKKNLKRKTGKLQNKIPDIKGLVTTIVLTTKTGEVESKVLDTSGLLFNTVLTTKIGKVKKRYLNMLNILLHLNLINFLV